MTTAHMQTCTSPESPQNPTHPILRRKSSAGPYAALERPFGGPCKAAKRAQRGVARTCSSDTSEAVDAPDASEAALPANEASEAEEGEGEMRPLSPAVGTIAPPMTAQRPPSTNQVSVHSALVNSAHPSALVLFWTP